MEELEKWRNVRLVNLGVTSMEFNIIHRPRTVNVSEIEALDLLECLNILESKVNKLMELACVESVQILLLNQFALENALFVIGSHLVDEEIEEEFLGRLLPVITNLDEEEGVNFANKEAIGIALVIFTEYLDGELLIIIELIFGWLINVRARPRR